MPGVTLDGGGGSGSDVEAANFLEQGLDLGAIGWRWRARQPELLEGVGGVFRILAAERGGQPGGGVGAFEQAEGGHQEELSAAVAGIALQRFLQQGSRRIDAPEQQLGKS